MMSRNCTDKQQSATTSPRRPEPPGLQMKKRNAFNQNMMSGGLLADGPAEFGRQHNRRWLLTAYEAGDVVLHNAYAIHASTVNHDLENKIRLGTDLRFVNSARPWDTRWSLDYRFGDGV